MIPETLEEKVIRLLMDKRFFLTTAESCTGGLLAGRLLNVSGASAVYREGYITYANEAKERILGVSRETLTQYGAVSEQTAGEMAVGAAKVAGAQAAVSVTGIAGPGGGTEEKPVGLVYIGCALCGQVRVKRFLFSGSRQEIRSSAVEAGLRLLLEMLEM